MAENDGQEFVRITNREVYERLGTVEAKLDSALSTIDKQNMTLIDYGKRVRALELRFYGILAGLLGAIAVLARVGGIG